LETVSVAEEGDELERKNEIREKRIEVVARY
jgi:hypothetical protein